MYDVAIIGAGVSGCAIARELSRYKLTIAVLDKEEDVCNGTSKANSAIVHAGFDAAPGSLMAKLNLQGNEMMKALCEELDVPFKQNGSLVMCSKKEDLPKLEELYERGIQNNVKGLQILNEEQVKQIEPNAADCVCAALYAPTGGIVCPFTLTIAMAENACVNGAEFLLNTEVINIERHTEGYCLETSKGEIKAKVVINAAGVYADKFHNMICEDKIHITPRKGEYCLLDKTAGKHVTHTIFQLPNEMGKGILVTPTVHGNLLTGPTAEDIDNKEGTNTTRVGLDNIAACVAISVKDVPMRQVITSFAGLRAHEDNHEFIIRQSAKGFIDVAGIESPGLTSAPAIGIMAAELATDILKPQKKENFVSRRKGIVNPNKLNTEERAALIRENPAYGNIICRCEMVSEGEILDAIHRPVGAKSLDGVKRRTRAGMGRCQAGFCSPRTMEILKRELHMEMEDITKCGEKSFIVTGHDKEDISDDR